MIDTVLHIAALALLSAFYLSYIVKMLMLRRQNIQGDILGKGEKPKDRARLEITMKTVIYFGAAIQFVSVIFDRVRGGFSVLPALRVGGLCLMALGAAAFISAIAVMRNNWRAGFSQGQNTSLVTGGIYKFSRNPAFLGFDLLYLGCASAFPNAANMAVALAAIVLFHLQIRGEETFLAGTFGDDYKTYKAATMRYLGRRKTR
jgi:protein-S-isoprenylcysteine O-methyltransferase Ste14